MLPAALALGAAFLFGLGIQLTRLVLGRFIFGEAEIDRRVVAAVALIVPGVIGVILR